MALILDHINGVGDDNRVELTAAGALPTPSAARCNGRPTTS